MFSSGVTLAASLMGTLELLFLALTATSTLLGRSRDGGLSVTLVFLSVVTVSVAPPASSGGVVMTW
jgi:hypothetical protein